MLAFLLALACLAPQEADARYELGRRLKALEPAWLRATPAERAPLLADWRAAVRGYFRGDMGAAAEALDGARARLSGGELPWAESLALVPAVHLVDVARPSLGLTLEAVYDAPRPARFRITSVGKPPGATWSAEVAQLPWSGELPLELAQPGPQVIRLELTAEGARPCRRELRFAASFELEVRMDGLAAGMAQLGELPATVEAASARGAYGELETLVWEPRAETDVDGDALLAQAQVCLASAVEGLVWSERAAPGQRRLWIPVGERDVPVRVSVPGGLREHETRALVLALHGAGGSENLFFEGYGAGAIVGLCGARGWLLAAPRIGLERPLDGGELVALVDALADVLPVDLARVYVVGHSLGAMLACAAVNAAPGRFRAVALLGGAGGMASLEDWRAQPVFLGAGELDFGRRAVEGLARELEQGGAEDVLLRVYPATEHITVVGAALPDVFTMLFDRVDG